MASVRLVQTALVCVMLAAAVALGVAGCGHPDMVAQLETSGGAVAGSTVPATSTGPVTSGLAVTDTVPVTGATPTPTTPPSSAEPASSTSTSAPILVCSPVVLSGPAVITRPAGTELFAKSWGKNPGQVEYDLWEQGIPSQNPIEVAVSPDGSTVAVLDYANSRAELFGIDGRLERVIPLSSASGFADIGYDGTGRLLVLTYGTLLELPAKDGGDVVQVSLPVRSPVELAPNGAEMWVVLARSTYLVSGPAGPLTPAEQAAAPEQPGVPAGDHSFLVLKDGTECWVVITNNATGLQRSVEISSPDLPLDEIRTLGADQAGDVFVMVRVYREGWQRTESWCFVGLSATGEYLGQVRLPLDFWAGGGYAVTPDGRILEQRSTEKGIILTTYELQP